MEEHPEDSNFKNRDQEGQPDYDKAQPYSKMSDTAPKPEKVEKGYDENDRSTNSGGYQEGTVDEENVNNARPVEVPVQQKGREKVDEDEKEHIET
jgi:hypothetical protein